VCLGRLGVHSSGYCAGFSPASLSKMNAHLFTIKSAAKLQKKLSQKNNFSERIIIQKIVIILQPIYGTNSNNLKKLYYGS